MKGILTVLAAAFLVLSASPAWAGSKIGAAPALVNFTVDDPDGDAENMSGLAPLALAFVYDLNNKMRLYGTANYIDFELDASTSRIGQDVTGYQVSAAWQHIVKFSHALKFYAGLGLAYTQADFENRFTIDSDGFLARRFPDRQEGFFSAQLCASREWELTERVDLGFDLNYQLALAGDGFSGLRAALTCFYKF